LQQRTLLFAAICHVVSVAVIHVLRKSLKQITCA